MKTDNPNIQIAILSEPLSIDTAYQSVLDDSCGGNVVFVGTVRNQNKGKVVTHLNFDTYGEMAVKELFKIAQQAISQYQVVKVCIQHRKGMVGIRDIAVVIAVSSKHRSASFEACKFVIDTLKETVPIWKKEHLEDGSYWVGARP